MAMLSMGTADPRDQQKLEAERLVKLLNWLLRKLLPVAILLVLSYSVRVIALPWCKIINGSQNNRYGFKSRTLMPQMLLALVWISMTPL